MTRSSRRGPWLPEEDHALMELVRTQGPNNWVRISQQLEHRSPKQCRERYHQNLKPSLNHEPISAQEGEVIEQMVHEMGKRWAEIARRLGNRSDNAVKNWWNGSMNRRKRNPSQHNGLKHIGNRLHPIPLIRPERSHIDLPPLPPYTNHSMHRAVHERQNHWHQLPSMAAHEYKDEGFCFGTDTRSSFQAQPTTFEFGSRRSQPDIFDPSSRYIKSELPPLRLPLPNNSHSDWQPSLCRQDERPLVSPAISETSQAPSARQEPSLISDSQSTYSISPRTITSPRLGLQIHINSTTRNWNLYHGSKSHPSGSLRFHGATSGLIVNDSYLPVEAACTNSSYSNFEPTIRRSDSPSEDALHHVLGKNDVTKDTRMHVSNLLD